MTSTENFDKIYLDTAPLVYFIEGHPQFSVAVETYLADAISENASFCMSTVSYMEFSVYPERANRQDLITQLDELIVNLSIPIQVIDLSIAKLAAKLRAKYSFLKGMDAIQLAAALTNQCTHFFTNDKKLIKIIEIEIVLVSER